MTNNKYYFLFYPIKRDVDLLKGFKEKINKERLSYHYKIELSDTSYLLIRNTEYNTEIIKFIKRLISYRKIFKQYDEILINKINSVNKNSQIYLCIADEGVWGEYIKGKKYLLKKYGYNVKTVNVQHGIFFLGKKEIFIFRRLVNIMLKLIIGYPLFGLDFGRSHFDVYYVYSEKEKKYLEKVSPNSEIIIAPQICLYDTLHKVNILEKKLTFSEIKQKEFNILFAMQYLWVRSDIIYSEEELYKRLLPMFELIVNKYNYKIIFRLHPGTKNKENTIRLLKDTGLYNLVQIDRFNSVEESLSRTSVVISFCSTVLVYALYLNRLPISITGIFRREKEFPSKHEEISLDNWEYDLANVFLKKDEYKIMK